MKRERRDLVAALLPSAVKFSAIAAAAQQVIDNPTHERTRKFLNVVVN